MASHFPEAKIILTLRDEEAWWQSINNTILRNFRDGDEVVDPARVKMRRMTRDLIVRKVFGGNINDRDHVLAAYHRNTEEVKAGVPKERLLIFDVAEGWEPLCKFLDQPIPNDPFPHTNTTKNFQDRIAERKVQSKN